MFLCTAAGSLAISDNPGNTPETTSIVDIKVRAKIISILNTSIMAGAWSVSVGSQLTGGVSH